ncbi:hypothetical protein Tco_0562650 [Tanacetum coccineum]
MLQSLAILMMFILLNLHRTVSTVSPFVNTASPVKLSTVASVIMLCIDGVSFDWSDMAEEQVQKNMTLMAFSDSKRFSIYRRINSFQFRKNEVLFSEEVAVLKRDVACKDYEINVLIWKPLMNDKGFVDSGCSRHMTGNIAYLSDFKEFDGGIIIMENISILEKQYYHGEHSYYPTTRNPHKESKEILKRYWEILPKEILKRYWEILPKEILKRYWEILPK